MKKYSIALIYLGAFFLSFSYGVFLSLPLFVEHIGGNEAITGKILAVCGIGTISAVLISKILLKKINGKYVAVAGGVAYLLGTIGFWLVHKISFGLFFAGILIGMGWGFYYNAAPYMLSSFANQQNRSVLFSYLSAFSVLGTGIAPIIIKLIWAENINFSSIFEMSAAACLLSALFFLIVNFEYTSTQANNNVSVKNAVMSVLDSPAKYPLMMVFLGACAFTMMLNFQTTYANSIGMNYAYFYSVYSLSVICSRFFLGKYIAKFDQYKLSIFLLSLMTFSLLFFYLSPFSKYIYLISSALFGISYGLIYPTIQAIAVNTTKDELKSDVISFFSLSYFIGVYAFPPLGGFLIVNFGYNSLIFSIALLSGIELLLSFLLYKEICLTQQIEEVKVYDNNLSCK